MIALIRLLFCAAAAAAAAMRGVPLRLAIVLVLLVVTGVAPADACPLCHTETGEKVRQGIFGADFWRNLFITALPFVVVGEALGQERTSAPVKNLQSALIG